MSGTRNVTASVRTMATVKQEKKDKGKLYRLCQKVRSSFGPFFVVDALFNIAESARDVVPRTPPHFNESYRVIFVVVGMFLVDILQASVFFQPIKRAASLANIDLEAVKKCPKAFQITIDKSNTSTETKRILCDLHRATAALAPTLPDSALRFRGQCEGTTYTDYS